MGQNVDVCSKDETIDEYFWKKHGSKDESALQFFSRTYEKFCDSLVCPQRMPYSSGFLTRCVGGIDPQLHYEIREFKVFSQGLSLHCCCWIRNKDYFLNNPRPAEKSTAAAESKDCENCAEESLPIPLPLPQQLPVHSDETNDDFTPPKPLCILYLHNNTRCLADALEVLPVAHALKASIFAFDLPGCGRSEGSLTATMDKDVAQIIEWIKCIIHEDVQVIVWGRGMSTGLVIQYCASINLNAIGAATTTRRSYSSGNGGTNSTECDSSSSFSLRSLLFGSRSTASESSKQQARCSESERNNAAVTSSPLSPPPVIAVVLDTPFVGIEQVVMDLVRRSQRSSLRVPKTIIRAASKIVLRSLAKRLNGLNLFDIRPIESAPHCALPCFILAASADDYIPITHCKEIAQQWGRLATIATPSVSSSSSAANTSASCKSTSATATSTNNRNTKVHVVLREFEGRQFDERTPAVILQTFDFLRFYADPTAVAATTTARSKEFDISLIALESAGRRTASDDFADSSSRGSSSSFGASSEATTASAADGDGNELLSAAEAAALRQAAACCDDDDDRCSVEFTAELEKLALQHRTAAAEATVVAKSPTFDTAYMKLMQQSSTTATVAAANTTTTAVTLAYSDTEKCMNTSSSHQSTESMTSPTDSDLQDELDPILPLSAATDANYNNSTTVATAKASSSSSSSTAASTRSEQATSPLAPTLNTLSLLPRNLSRNKLNSVRGMP